jgi:hypothetical protein
MLKQGARKKKVTLEGPFHFSRPVTAIFSRLVDDGASIHYHMPGHLFRGVVWAGMALAHCRGMPDSDFSSSSQHAG